MCFSERVSLLTFGLGTGFGGLITQLPKPEDKVIGLFLAFVSLMQGIEALLWRHQVCDSYNQLLTTAGMWLNHLQPLVLLGLSALYFPTKLNIILPLGVIYTIGMALYTYQQKTSTAEQKCTLKDTCTNHLLWKWNGLEHAQLFYGLFMIILFSTPLLVFKDTSIAKFSALAGVLSWTVSAAIYPPHIVGALWCFFTTFLPTLYFSLRVAKIL